MYIHIYTHTKTHTKNNTQTHSTELPISALLDRTGLTPANLDIVLAELQRAGLLTVVKHPGGGNGGGIGEESLFVCVCTYICVCCCCCNEQIHPLPSPTPPLPTYHLINLTTNPNNHQ